MSWKKLLRSRRGQSSAIGMIFMILVFSMIINVMFESNRASLELSTQDSERASEKVGISYLLFGGVSSNYPTSTTPTGSGSISNIRTADQSYVTFNGQSGYIKNFPVGNMNFTSNKDGWYFYKTTTPTPATGVAVGFLQGEGYTSPGSGPGSIYASLEGLGLGPYWLNWTYYFTYNDVPPNSAYFSWAWRVDTLTSPSVSIIYVTLDDPSSSPPREIISVNVISYNIGQWYYSSIVIPTSAFNTPGAYSLSLSLNAGISSGKQGAIRILYDDVGIGLNVKQGYVADCTYIFSLSEDPKILEKLELQYVGHYSAISTTSTSSTSTMTSTIFTTVTTTTLTSETTTTTTTTLITTTTTTSGTTTFTTATPTQTTVTTTTSGTTTFTTITPTETSTETSISGTTVIATTSTETVPQTSSTRTLTSTTVTATASSTSYWTSTYVKIKTTGWTSWVGATTKWMPTTITTITSYATTSEVWWGSPVVQIVATTSTIYSSFQTATWTTSSKQVTWGGGGVGTTITFQTDTWVWYSTSTTKTATSSTLLSKSTTIIDTTSISGTTIYTTTLFSTAITSTTTGTSIITLTLSENVITSSTSETSTMMINPVTATTSTFYFLSTTTTSQITEISTAGKTTFTPTISVSQMMYIWDYESGTWVKLSTIIVGTTDLTQGPYAITESVLKYVSPAGEVMVRILGESTVAMVCYADLLEVKDYYKDRTKLLIQVNNAGSSNVELASLWINNSTYHKRLALSPAITLAPGNTYTHTISQLTSFPTVDYTIKVTTRRGSTTSVIVPYTD